jgi:UDP-GlcNAc3NAcA epimerase
MPEEINRITTDHLSTFLFTPTLSASQQLLIEGIKESQIHYVGDVMCDATTYYNRFNEQRRSVVDELGLKNKQYCLVTIHRAENTDNEDRLINICKAMIELGCEHKIVLPLHPRTRNILNQINWLKPLEETLLLIEPVGYLDMLALECFASHIVTDSGGVQKEAYFNRVPCITLRDENEWVELVQSGWNTLCSPEKPFSLIPLLEKNTQTDKPYQEFYGNGDAARRILELLC